MKIIDLTYHERYKIWFKNNYESGMEFNPDHELDFEDEYWKPTPIKKIIYDNNKTIYLTKAEFRNYTLNKIIDK